MSSNRHCQASCCSVVITSRDQPPGYRGIYIHLMRERKEPFFLTFTFQSSYSMQTLTHTRGRCHCWPNSPMINILYLCVLCTVMWKTVTYDTLWGGGGVEGTERGGGEVEERRRRGRGEGEGWREEDGVEENQVSISIILTSGTFVTTDTHSDLTPWLVFYHTHNYDTLHHTQHYDWFRAHS